MLVPVLLGSRRLRCSRVLQLGVSPYREMMREMQRIGTPTFEGGVTPEQADEWRQRLERNFDSVRCPAQFQVELAVHYLGGDAHLWWRSVRTRREVWTWVDFVEEFNHKFFPQEARDRLQLRFLDLTQGERSVREYDAEFCRLVVFSGGELISERALTSQFLQGLRRNIRTQCRGGMYHTRAGLVELAASIEEDLREPVSTAVVPVAVAPATHPRGQQQHQQRRGHSSGYGRGSRPAQGQKRRAEEISASSPSTGGCFGCGSLDHRVATCPKRAGSRETTVCFYCREPGHIKTMCPKLQQRAVATAIQPLAIQPVAQIAALQSGGAPRVYTSAEVGQTSQSGQITGNSNVLPRKETERRG
uniref:CCHC-type domain-containing protein n=2 Tax=Noccaea caerulescens TaxID=107243 RepID=A0A1J3DMB2_NOCCA